MLSSPPPAGLRVPRLEQILGSDLSGLTFASIRQLVDDAVPEDAVLEYKRQMYEPGDGGKKALATDVAALANGAGGLIVIGVGETDGVAAELVGATAADQDQLRLRQVLTARIAPFVDGVWIAQLADDSDESESVVLIAVPPSIGPHAVVADSMLRWPVRDGAGTRFLSEPELANRYRSRFNARETDRLRLDDSFDEAAACLARGLDGWLVIAASPDREGSLEVNSAGINALKAWLDEAQQGSLQQRISSNTSTSVGRRRYIHSDEFDFRGKSRNAHLEFHADGTAVGAVNLAVPTSFEREPNTLHLGASAEAIEVCTVVLLGLLAAHAVRTGAGGDLLVRAQLLGADHPDAPDIWEDPQTRQTRGVTAITVAISEPFVLPPGVVMGERVVPGSRGVRTPSPSYITAPMSVATDRRDLAGSAAVIVGDLLNEFGVSGPRVLHADGTVDPSASHGAARTSWQAWDPAFSAEG